MKKNFTSFFIFAATMLVALTLTSCGEEVDIVDSKPTGATEFITESEDGTRTSMDDERYFYWEPGDNIYINTGGTTWVRSDDNTISGNAQATCKFIFNDTFTAGGYPVTYTGNDTTSTSATSVTIATTQTQKTWGNTEHFGESGDCGTATAARQDNGTYKFTLRHQAAYLRLQPYLNAGYMTESGYNGVFKLQKIEITSDNTIAGTFAFSHSEGIVTSSVTSPSSTITLNCKDGFNMASASGNNCYVVIRPGTHVLSIKYHVTDLGGATVTFTKVLDSKEYKPNGVTTIIHELGATGPDIMVFNPVFYRWGASAPWPAAQNTGTSPASAGMWAHSINQNEATWYIVHGDPRWDGVTPWMIEGDPTLYYGGVWVKKRANIPGYSHSANTNGGNNRHPNGSYYYAVTTLSGDAETYKTAGKPADTSGYFFLPALGYYTDELGWQAIGTHGDYWTISPCGTSASPNTIGTTYAFNVYFNSEVMGTHPVHREAGYIMGLKSLWFK